MRQHAGAARRTLAAALVALVVPVLGGCGDDDDRLAGGEYGADVQDVTENGRGFYAGPYGTSFAGDLASFTGEAVVLTADVDEVFSPSVFTITAPGGTDVEPLLVVGAGGDGEVAPGTGVEVTGTVRGSFAVADVAPELRVGLADEVAAGFAGAPYLEADRVERLPTGAG